MDVDPLTALARKMNLEVLDRELENLPDQLREPLVEHYLLGYSAPQIAERMELSVSAVEGRLRRGRHALRYRLSRRGISLSVLVAGSGLFQEHLAACEGASWTATFTKLYFPTGSEGDSPSPPPSASNSQVSSLVRGETIVVTPSSIKAVMAAGVLLVGGTIVALAVHAGDSPRGSGAASGNSLTIPTIAVEPAVLAQFGSTSNSAEPKGEESQDGGMALGGSQFGGYAGGSQGGRMSGGGMGGGGMFMGSGGMIMGGRMRDGEMGGRMASGMAMSSGAAAEWVRPETEDDHEPAWLSGGRTALEAIEANRQVLSTKLDFNFQDMPLADVAKWLTEETGTQFELNTVEIELAGRASVDSPITAQGRESSVREIIRRSMSGLGLTYVVTESTIEITTQDNAIASPSVRYYDLSYVLPNSANAAALVKAIEYTIEPDEWLSGDSTISLVGSTMIVNAPDTTHQKVELLLINVAKMNPHNVEQPSWVNPAAVSVSGGFGGGGS
ncbi:MAG: RNA polymerase sigma factor, partial [Planctomycetales bacterium]|nr:RNA polymerase sigma factor [Planctomycetales bacterium]